MMQELFKKAVSDEERKNVRELTFTSPSSERREERQACEPEG